MKKRFLHIGISFFVALGLLFSQVGVPYFHDQHDAHEFIKAGDQDQTQLHEHGEHCQVCSIDLFVSLFADSQPVSVFIASFSLTPGALPYRFLSIPGSLSQGRAPPGLLS